MLNNTIDHPIGLALLILSGLVAGPATLISLWRERHRAPGAQRWLAHLGVAQLALLWLWFIPLALLNRALGGAFDQVFGSYTQATSLIDYAAAANLSLACLLVIAVACAARPNWALLGSGLLLAVALAFTAIQEAGLTQVGPGTSFLTDALHAPVAPIVYSMGGLLVLVGAVAVLGAGERVKSRLSIRWLTPLITAPHVLALGLTTAMLAQHRLFEEVAELAFSAGVLQAVTALAICIPAARIASPRQAATQAI